MGAGAFFFEERPGKNGKLFKICKFKSMTDEKDDNSNLLLFNKLIGDMSFVEPHPLLTRNLLYYKERDYLRHSV